MSILDNLTRHQGMVYQMAACDECHGEYYTPTEPEWVEVANELVALGVFENLQRGDYQIIEA